MSRAVLTLLTSWDQVVAQKWRAESYLEAAASKTAMLSCRLNRCIDPTNTTAVPDLLLLGLQAREAVCQIEVDIEIEVKVGSLS